MTLLTRFSRFSRSTPHKTEIISFQTFPRRSQRICELFPIVASAFLDNLVGFNRACSGPALHLYGLCVYRDLPCRIFENGNSGCTMRAWRSLASLNSEPDYAPRPRCRNGNSTDAGATKNPQSIRELPQPRSSRKVIVR